MSRWQRCPPHGAQSRSLRNVREELALQAPERRSLTHRFGREEVYQRAGRLNGGNRFVPVVVHEVLIGRRIECLRLENQEDPVGGESWSCRSATNVPDTRCTKGNSKGKRHGSGWPGETAAVTVAPVRLQQVIPQQGEHREDTHRHQHRSRQDRSGHQHQVRDRFHTDTMPERCDIHVSPGSPRSESGEHPGEVGVGSLEVSRPDRPGLLDQAAGLVDQPLVGAEVTASEGGIRLVHEIDRLVEQLLDGAG